MAARACPHCDTELGATKVVALTNGVDCPKCGMRLEVASGGRTISTVTGFVVAAIIWRATSGAQGDLGGVLPTLYAFLSFGMVSSVVLMLTATLRNAPAEPVAEPAHAGGHGGSGHDSGSGGHGGHH